MAPNVSFQSQQLKYLKEDIEIKRKLMEKDEETEKELLIEAKKNEKNNGRHVKSND